LIYSPVLFVFQIASRRGGFFREILFFALLAAVAYAFTAAANDRRRFFVLCAGLALYPLLILSHEMFAFYLPYILVFAALLDIDSRRLTLVGLLLALSVAAAVCAALFNGSAGHVERICSSLVTMLPAYPAVSGCATEANAIRWLADDITSGLGIVQLFLPRQLGSVGPALLLIGIGFWPLVKLLDEPIGREVRLVLLAALISLLMSLVLFVFAIDWGRFLHVHVVALSLTLMAVAARAGSTGSGQAPSARPIPAWAIAAYFLAWNLMPNDVLVGSGLALQTVNHVVFGLPAFVMR
jgi:hypothetical protein